MSAFDVTVAHNQGAGRLWEFQPGDTLEGVFELQVEADDEHAACEVVWAITNSYPDEMFCGPEYAQAVNDYRALKLRSVSMGDVVIFGDNESAWTAVTLGWNQLPEIPFFTTPTCGACGQSHDLGKVPQHDCDLDPKNELLTPDEWQERTGIRIMDPDGWRGTMSDIAWTAPLPRNEFLRRASMCTVAQWPRPLRDET